MEENPKNTYKSKIIGFHSKFIKYVNCLKTENNGYGLF